MTEETIKRLYEHFRKLEKEGAKTGNPTREQLIKSDAKKNREEMEKKHPWLVEKKSNSKQKKET